MAAAQLGVVVAGGRGDVVIVARWSAELGDDNIHVVLALVDVRVVVLLVVVEEGDIRMSTWSARTCAHRLRRGKREAIAAQAAAAARRAQARGDGGRAAVAGAAAPGSSKPASIFDRELS